VRLKCFENKRIAEGLSGAIKDTKASLKSSKITICFTKDYGANTK
jgi:hypothetical protein